MVGSSMKQLFVDLPDAHEFGREVVGGKAAVLSELASDGFPVPPGFVVTPDALDAGGNVTDEPGFGDAVAKLRGWTFRGPFLGVGRGLA